MVLRNQASRLKHVSRVRCARGEPPRLELVAPLRDIVKGVAVRDLRDIVSHSGDVLGEGAFGRVAKIDISGCGPLCVKIIIDESSDEDDETSDENYETSDEDDTTSDEDDTTSDEDDTTSATAKQKIFQECWYMKTLEAVPGLPRVVGFSAKPLAFLMTRHGRYNLWDVMEGHADGLNLNAIQVLKVVS